MRETQRTRKIGRKENRRRISSSSSWVGGKLWWLVMVTNAIIVGKICEASSSYYDTTASSRFASMLVGECALVDKETGRIYWQSNTDLIESSLRKPYWSKLESRLKVARHVRSTILSSILWISFFRSTILSFHYPSPTPPITTTTTTNDLHGLIYSAITKCIKVINQVLECLIWIIQTLVSIVIPKLNGKWIALVTMLYFMESYTCNTKQYLTNALTTDSHELETYLENLRSTRPTVEWKVQCFHYEKRFTNNILLRPLSLFLSNQREKKNANKKHTVQRDEDGILVPSSTNNNNGDENSSNIIGNPSSVWDKKVITHEATRRYEFDQWQDGTVAGVWKRAESSSSLFTKLSLTKMLVLANANARRDYFAQQANFVRTEGQNDSFAQFSTNIRVEGYKPKLLAVRSLASSSLGIQKSKERKVFSIHLFWLFTMLGLTVPFRIWFAQHCDQLKVTVVKETFARNHKKLSSNNDNNNNNTTLYSWLLSPKTWLFGSNTGTLGEQNTNQYETISPSSHHHNPTFRKRMEQFSLYDLTSKKSSSSTISKQPEPQKNDDWQEDLEASILEAMMKNQTVKEDESIQLSDYNNTTTNISSISNVTQPILTTHGNTTDTLLTVVPNINNNTNVTVLHNETEATNATNENNGDDETTTL